MNKRVHKKRLKKQGLYVNPKETLDLNCNIAKYVLPRLKLFKKLNNKNNVIKDDVKKEHFE